MGFVLGHQGLSAAEAGLIKTILKLSSSLHAAWAVADSGAFDLLLLGELQDAVQVPSGVPVVHLRRRGEAGAAKALYRPIRAEELIELLNDFGGRVAPDAPPAATIPVATQGGAARLNRWPPYSLLNGKPVYVRLSSLLTKQALSAAQLSALSGLPLAECESFMHALDSLDLLVREPQDPARIAVVPQEAVVARRGLLSTLRRKLGIERARA